MVWVRCCGVVIRVAGITIRGKARERTGSMAREALVDLVSQGQREKTVIDAGAAPGEGIGQVAFFAIRREVPFNMVRAGGGKIIGHVAIIACGTYGFECQQADRLVAIETVSGTMRAQ